VTVLDSKVDIGGDGAEMTYWVPGAKSLLRKYVLQSSACAIIETAGN